MPTNIPNFPKIPNIPNTTNASTSGNSTSAPTTRAAQDQSFIRDEMYDFWQENIHPRTLSDVVAPAPTPSVQKGKQAKKAE
jgi:hypothetical protein